jgi:hypothetical protein
MTSGAIVRRPTSLAPTGNGRRFVAPALEKATRTRSSLTFDSAYSFESWQQLGAHLGGYASSSMWWLGDWLDFGHQMYGSRYKLGVALTGLDDKTLRNYAYVARRVGASRRRDTLSFQHHAEVAALAPDQQDLWLDQAQAEGWTRSELRQRLRAALKRPSPPVVVLSMQLSREHPWCQAAQRIGADVHAWIEETLNEAASSLLSDLRPLSLPSTTDPSGR